MKSLDFRRERESSWRELEGLLDRVDGAGIASLAPDELGRLPILYRAALSALSVAREISLDVNLREYLESLATRAYLCVYATRDDPLVAVERFVGVRFPAAVRRFRRHVAVAVLLLALGTATGRVLVLQDPDRFYALVPAGVASGRSPASSTDDLRKVLYGSGGPADALTAFAMALFTHNALVGMTAFALGFAAGIPAVVLLFYNGAILGAFAALYEGRGIGLEFWAWVMPHGFTELLAVALCGGAGLVTAESLLFPGRHTRLENLAERGPQAGVILLGAILLLLVAGLIEGIFRQTVRDVGVRAGLAATTALAWGAYFTLAGRERQR